MKICKVLMTVGALGAGIVEEAFERAMEMSPDIIVADGGSTDSGPFYLGSGQGKYAREVIKSDLAIMIKGGHKIGVPIMIGSCGTCGSDAGVDLYADIAEEIFREEGFRMKLAKIYTQQDPQMLKEKWIQGKIHELEGAPKITEKTFDECSNIVALAGAEPFIKALQDGAQVILCGRATDTADIAALPIIKGCHEGAAWHAAKIIECGAQCLTDPTAGCVMAEIDDIGFKVYPTIGDIKAKATPYTIAAHMLYENADPITLFEPSGILNTSGAVYTQADDRSVYVQGSTYEHAKQYTMKLEGAGPAGFQTVSLVGIADKHVLANFEKWMKNLTQYVVAKITSVGIPATEYDFDLKPYGYNAVTGGKSKEGTPMPKEIGLLLTVTAKTQKVATEVSKIWGPYLLHFPVSLDQQLPSFAFPFSPSYIEKGELYEFKLHHIIDIDDPLELCRIVYID
jgi:hypothetical protein